MKIACFHDADGNGEAVDFCSEITYNPGMIQHQTIFQDRVYKQKLSNFSLDMIPGLTAKKKIIEKYIRALGSGRIERTKEESIQADFLNKFFGDILDYEYNDPFCCKRSI